MSVWWGGRIKKQKHHTTVDILTVANPHSTLLILSMDSTASLPSSRRVGSCVARYRYIALSISSAKKPANSYLLQGKCRENTTVTCTNSTLQFKTVKVLAQLQPPVLPVYKHGYLYIYQGYAKPEINGKLFQLRHHLSNAKLR